METVTTQETRSPKEILLGSKKAYLGSNIWLLTVILLDIAILKMVFSNEKTTDLSIIAIVYSLTPLLLTFIFWVLGKLLHRQYTYPKALSYAGICLGGYIIALPLLLISNDAYWIGVITGLQILCLGALTYNLARK